MLVLLLLEAGVPVCQHSVFFLFFANISGEKPAYGHNNMILLAVPYGVLVSQAIRIIPCGAHAWEKGGGEGKEKNVW